ncbi:MAG: molybdopterin-synthase adenylyltransferase MoeB [Gemmatimonadetes bacterium]|nr:molybdopterin-synthase adenylyltransferase MoeB [Gemmatimonadota bacterium]MBP6442842.1 molybdopterin-synthase adenylyltransferase MoeB [Gemmatimonadales bacterium]MBP9898295.1 molybdopterin-synthase adenylyltransferase MoeB [Gemmatimonadales bacterium]
MRRVAPHPSPVTRLSSDELQRYARHLTLPEVGVAGQERLSSARILLIGAGGLGSPAALYLAAAGIGTIGIVDADVVDASNLQRQVLHDTPSIGHLKVVSAKARLEALNPFVRVEPIAERLTAANARAIIARYDLVVDGSDNFPTRYLVNDACVLEGKPFVYGSIFRFEGQLSLFGMPGGPCYRCLFAEPPSPELVPSCVEAGVIGVLPGLIGTLQALEAIKWVLGIGRSAAGRLLLVDALGLTVREIAVARDPACAVCGDTPSVTALVDYDAFCGLTPLTLADGEGEVTPTELSRALGASELPVLLDVREEWEVAIAVLPGSTVIPLGELPARLLELPTTRPIVTVCHHGLRSAAARDLLRRAGFPHVTSLAGGVDAWARLVDQQMARY